MMTFAFFLWGLMILLSLTGIGEVGSEFIAFVGSGIFAAWFWVRGAYKNKAALQNLLVTLGGTVLDMIPFVNDMPIMVIEVGCVILATQREDRVIAAANAAKNAKIAQQQMAVQAKQQAAYAAAMNANAMRDQALAESKRVAEMQEVERIAQNAAK